MSFRKLKPLSYIIYNIINVDPYVPFGFEDKKNSKKKTIMSYNIFCNIKNLKVKQIFN